MTISLMVLDVECCYAEYRYNECRNYLNAMLNVFMLSVDVLSVIKLNVIMLNVVAPPIYMLIINESISWQNVLVYCHFPDLKSYNNINILKSNVMSCRLMGVEVI
jgi:hypothetical protein